jgi:hypothetical protein
VIAACKSCTDSVIDRGYDSKSVFVYLRFTDQPEYHPGLVHIDEAFHQPKFRLSEVVKKIEDHEPDVT